MGAKKLSFMSWFAVIVLMASCGRSYAQPQGESLLLGQAREAAIGLLESRISDVIADLMMFRTSRQLDALTAAYKRESAELSDLRMEMSDVVERVGRAGWIAGCGPRMTLLLLQAEFLIHEAGVKDMEQTLTEYQQREKILNDLMGMLRYLKSQ